MRIGLVLNVLDEDYQIAIFKGIKKRTEELGIELFCIQQEKAISLKTSLGASISKKVFQNLDGIVYLTSVMADVYEVDSKDDLREIFNDIPIISVGQRIKGIPSLITQTDFSMKQLVEHLILFHNYRRFVFFSGPQNHPDAIAREEIFKKTMEAYIPWYSDLTYKICYGLFTEAAAIDLMTNLYNKNPKEKIDVVVCSNDNMAIGVYKFFKMNRNKKNIKECAVTGFDDISQLQYNMPSITTVHQPLEEIGHQAVDNLLKIIDGKKLPELEFVESRLVLRNSCGCKTPTPKIDNRESFIDDLQTEFYRSEQLLRTVSRFALDASNSMSMDVLRYFVKLYIEQLEVNNMTIVLFDKVSEDSNLKIKPFLVYNRAKNMDSFFTREAVDFDDFVRKLILSDGENQSYIFKYLMSGNECIGCALYSCDDAVYPYLSSVIVTISQAMARIMVAQEKQKRSDYLESEVEKRTHELIEANNKRLEVEAEILKISEMERQRFSNDLHDDICQRLAGISMLCRSYSNQNNPVEKDQMVELAELITDTLQTTRQYAHNSFPVELETLGLNDSINNLCNSFEKQSEIKCEYEWNVSEELEFDATQKLNIFRIIQEALHNIMKHSKATNTKVSVIQKNNVVSITVVDDGCGLYITGDGNSPGLGINSMQYRANQIEASFEIVNNSPKGTRVTVELKIGE